jgi:glutaconate CoA-transferase subunit B
MSDVDGPRAAPYSAAEMMAIAAARQLRNDDVCFVGIGAPSLVCNLARLTHAPDITLIYESGTVGARPDVLPLSIGDPELCETARTTVSVPEMFAYWLQGGRISVGFLGGAQLDRFANINSSVIGPYEKPKVRLPGGGGAPEIAALCRQTYVVMAQTKRSFVQRVDFITSFGFGDGGDHRQRLGIRTAGPTLVITDLCVMQPDPSTKELVATALHPGVTREQVVENTGWPIRFADPLGEPPPPTPAELSTLRDLQRRTTEAHTRGRTPRTQPEGSDPLARAVIPSERSESRDLHSGSAP